MADSYKTNQVLFSYSNDFSFSDPENTFGLMDEIIKFV